MTSSNITTSILIVAFIAVGLLATGKMPLIGGEKGNGNVTTSNRKVTNFHGVQVGSGIDLVLTQGNAESCKVITDENLQSKVTVEVKNGTLEIYVDGNIRNTKELKVEVMFKNLDEISASGGSDITANGQIQFDQLELMSSGGSDIDLQVTGTNLEIAASGGSDVVLCGDVKNCEVAISGGSDFKAQKLTINNCEIAASGGSDSYIYVKDAITVAASGGSDVHLSGNPAITKTLSSSSDLIRE